MYSVVYDGMLVYRSGSGELPAYDLHLAETESRPAGFSFQMPEGNPCGKRLETRKAEVVVYDSRDGALTERNEIFRGKITGIETDFQNGRRIECTGVLSYLNNSVQRQSEHHDETAAQFLAYLLDRHNEQVSGEERIYLGAVTVRDENDSIYRYTNYETTLECIEKKLLDVLGGHLEIRRSGGKNYLDYLAEYRNTSGQPVEFGRNLLDFSKNMDASEVYTVCIPLGARLEESPIEALDAYLTIESVNGGKDYVENQAAIAVYGRRVKVVSWGDVTVPANLKRKAEEWLVRNQYENLSLEVTAVDLSMTGEEFEGFRMGDETLVYSKPHGLDRRFPITARDCFLDAPEKNTITMGKSVVGGIVGSIHAGQQETSDRLSKILSNSQLLAMAKHNATQLITAAMNGYVVTSPDEILIMDTPKKETAKRVWRWNLGGLGYSKNGYEGPYETAMTMDGAIVADFITTGILNADLIKAGTINADLIKAGILSGIIMRSITERSMLEINGARMHFSFNDKKYGYVGIYGPAEKDASEWTLEDMRIGISADERSGGVRIYSNDVDSDKMGYTIAHFTCEDKDSRNTISKFYGKQMMTGERSFYGTSAFKGELDLEDRVNVKSPLLIRRADGTLCGKLWISGNNGDVILAGLSGKNKAALGYTDDESAGIGGIVEASTAWSDYWARIQGGLRITGNMAATGTKNRIVDIGDRKILMNAYETADCMFGDSGSGIFDFKGELTVNLDETFKKTIEGDYSLFAYGYSEPVKVKEKGESGFVLLGKPGSRVDYEIRAKQRGYANVRMEEFKEDEDGGH